MFDHIAIGYDRQSCFESGLNQTHQVRGVKKKRKKLLCTWLKKLSIM